jgi:hypothetical protein
MASQAVVEAVDATVAAGVSAHDVRDADAAVTTLRKWFTAADRDADGVVNGVEAQRFFARCEPPLSQRSLATVWALADQKRQGFLDRDAFGVAMRLVAQVQRGKTPSLEARLLCVLAKHTPARLCWLMHACDACTFAGLRCMLVNAQRTRVAACQCVQALEEATVLELPRFAGEPPPPRSSAPTPVAPPSQQQQQRAEGGGGASGSGVGSFVREWRARASASAAKRGPLLPGAAARSISDGLAALYAKRVRPAEEAYAYGAFADSPPLEPVDFSAKPLVLLLGQYSCGKTTFITHLLGRSFPLAVIGALWPCILTAAAWGIAFGAVRVCSDALSTLRARTRRP